MNTIEGLNKVDCFVVDSSYNGNAVTISNNNNTWEQTLADSHAVFMIPNIPAPAKQSYTVTLHDGDSSQEAVYQRVVELGFGDSIKVGLYSADERATQGDINTVEAEISDIEDDLAAKITYGRTDLAAGSSELATGTIYCYY